MNQYNAKSGLKSIWEYIYIFSLSIYTYLFRIYSILYLGQDYLVRVKVTNISQDIDRTIRVFYFTGQKILASLSANFHKLTSDAVKPSSNPINSKPGLGLHTNNASNLFHLFPSLGYFGWESLFLPWWL